MTATKALQVYKPQSAVAEPLDLDAMLELAKQLVPTGFLPDHIKSAGQCVAIILTGRELGMQPMRAIRSLQMVKGKVVENADSQLARFKSDKGKAVFKELTDTKAVLWLKHPNGDEHTETFGLEDAKRAGLLSNPSWQKYPRAMLRSRCITAGLKSVGWEGGVGTYDPEEAHSLAPSVVVDEPLAVVESNVPMATDEQRQQLAAFAKSGAFKASSKKKFQAAAESADLTAEQAEQAIEWATQFLKDHAAKQAQRDDKAAEGTVVEGQSAEEAQVVALIVSAEPAAKSRRDELVASIDDYMTEPVCAAIAKSWGSHLGYTVDELELMVAKLRAAFDQATSDTAL